MYNPTFVPNLATSAWKMSPGMLNEPGSLNGPLCAYLMRQNLHWLIKLVWDLEAINILAKFENDPWKILHVRALYDGAWPPCRPSNQSPARWGEDNTRSPKGCGVKILGRFNVEPQAAAFMYISNWVDAGIVYLWEPFGSVETEKRNWARTCLTKI